MFNPLLSALNNFNHLLNNSNKFQMNKITNLSGKLLILRGKFSSNPFSIWIGYADSEQPNNINRAAETSAANEECMIYLNTNALFYMQLSYRGNNHNYKVVPRVVSATKIKINFFLMEIPWSLLNHARFLAILLVFHLATHKHKMNYTSYFVIHWRK